MKFLDKEMMLAFLIWAEDNIDSETTQEEKDKIRKDFYLKYEGQKSNFNLSEEK